MRLTGTGRAGARAWLPGVAICQSYGGDCIIPNGLTFTGGRPSVLGSGELNKLLKY
jgi:hypothetical protein